MPLWDDLTYRVDEAKHANRTRCRFGKIIDSLPDEEREALAAALDMYANEKDVPIHLRMFTAAWFTTTFNSNGYPVGKTAVGEHLKGACSCDTSK